MPRNADETRAQLIRAAERLFAERGVEAVSLREVNREAHQRNASALQYHFEDRQGLLRAILAKHEIAVEASRHALLDEIEKQRPSTLQRLSAALVLPAAEKLSDRDGGRNYLRIVSQLINSHAARVDPIAVEDEASSLHRWRKMVASMMSPLAVDPLHSRFTARRIMFVELARRAESPRRKDDRLFASHLIDLVTAILNAPISTETRSLLAERGIR
ncbi:MAG: helix-turn-helix domain-containing protein [Myxococcota bacterium]